MYTLKMFLEPRLKSSKCRKKERNELTVYAKSSSCSKSSASAAAAAAAAQATDAKCTCKWFVFYM